MRTASPCKATGCCSWRRRMKCMHARVSWDRQSIIISIQMHAVHPACYVQQRQVQLGCCLPTRTLQGGQGSSLRQSNSGPLNSPVSRFCNHPDCSFPASLQITSTNRYVRHVCCSYFLSGSHDSTVTVWDVKTLMPIRTHYNYDAAINDASFSHDSQLLALGGEEQTIKINNTMTGQSVAFFVAPKQFVCRLQVEQ